MTGNISIHSAVWATICGHIEFTLNFENERYILRMGSGITLSKMEYTDGKYVEQERGDVSREEVLELICQGDSGMWTWMKCTSMWLGFAACQKKTEDLMAYGEFSEDDYYKFKNDFRR